MVRSPLGLPLGDRGLLPLPDALPGVGAGVVAGGPYTVPKGCWIPIPGCPAGRGQGFFHISFFTFLHILQGGGSLLRPPAHVRATGLSGLGAGRPTGAPVSHPSLTHAHTRHTRPGSAVPLKPLSGGLHWWMSRGRPPMRGPGGALHGRCQPERWAGSGSVVGQGRQQGALTGGGAWGGHRGARRGGSGGVEAGARGERMSGLLRGLLRERACRGGAEGEATSAVLYWGSLTVPRAEAAGTRGRGVPGDGAWHWDVRAPDTVSTPPIGSARALWSGASHPAPSP